ncbi:MAG TPA: glycoside hydrolase family 15 protein [Ramlibacter sp.]
MIHPPRESSIEDYAAIGDCRTLALVSRFGSIDWCCMPEFSSPSVFGALLDVERGGRFAMTPRGIVNAALAYLPRTNVVRTVVTCERGELHLTDFMTPAEATDPEHPQEIVRIAECVAGHVELEVAFDPRPDYARMAPQIRAAGEGAWTCAAAAGGFALRSSFPLQGDQRRLHGTVAMSQGEVHAAVLTSPASAPVDGGPPVAAARAKLAATMDFWHRWCAGCTYEGAHADAVLRSALALKLLTHAGTGALVAAGTTSIPESETGARNWDYRFCWLRDSSLVFDAFTELGFRKESGEFLLWLLHATERTRPKLQVVYDMYGNDKLPEFVVDSLRGYHGIGPVHVGNAASSQVQHDVYGEVVMTAYDHARRGGELDAHECELLAGFAQVVCDIWRQPDNGIWEIRTAPRHNTHSKLLCWAALDRILALDEVRKLPVDVKRIAAEREAIRSDIEKNAWNDRLQSYVGYYGGEAPDASLLLIPRLGYIAPNDPRMLGTTGRIIQELGVDHGLLYRYPPGTNYDGLQGSEHLFAICSFWCVDCLARQGRVDEAERIYEQLLKLRNPAGLYAEEFGAHDGRPIGNFPQAFSHVGSITAALSLRAASGKSKGETT